MHVEQVHEQASKSGSLADLFLQDPDYFNDLSYDAVVES